MISILKQKHMSRKNEIIASSIGVVIGCILGYFISLGLIERSKEHELLIKENQLLHQELLNCQDSL